MVSAVLKSKDEIGRCMEFLFFNFFFFIDIPLLCLVQAPFDHSIISPVNHLGAKISLTYSLDFVLLSCFFIRSHMM